MRSQQSGCIVNISSVSGLISTPGFGWYSASKFAVEGLSDALRLEVGQFGISVVLIEPGVVATPFLAKQEDLLNGTDHPEAYSSVRQAPLKAVKTSGGGVDPHVVGTAIVNAINAENKPTRVVVPAESEMLIEVARQKSDREMDQILRDQLGI